MTAPDNAWFEPHPPADDALRSAEQRALLLAEAGRVIHTSLDPDETMRAIVRLAVPVFADYASVDLFDGKGAHRAAALHARPERQPIADALQKFPPDPSRAGTPAATAIEQRQAVIVRQWTDEWTIAKARNPEHARLLRELAPRSAIVVPMIGRAGDVLGVMTFMTADTGRAYGDADLGTADALALRATIAIENAELHSQSLQARDQLEQQAMEMELQTQQLQDQAAELEAQRDEMEQQATELEAVNEELQHVNEELILANEATRATERFVRGILEAIGDPFVVQDAEWRFRYINEAAAKVFVGSGRTAEQLVGRVSWDEYPELVGTSFEREMRRARSAGSIVVFEQYFARRGSWSEMRCYPLPDGGLATMWKDVTEQKRAEETLHYLSRASEILGSSLDYERTVQAVAELVVPKLADWCAVDLLAAPGRLERLAVAHVDPAKIRLAHELWHRYPTNLDLPNGIGEVLRTGKPELYREVTDEMLVAGAVDEEHLRISRELGLVSAIIVPLTVRERVLGAMTLVAAESGRRYTDADVALAGELAHRAAAAIDNARLYNSAIEAREEIETAREELEVMNEELHQTNEELVEKTRIAEDANRAKGMFLTHMSHELRTPLNAIGGYAQLMEIGVHGPVTSAQLEALQRIQRSQRHLLSLINDVLNFAKLESGRVDYRITALPVAPLVAGLEALVAPQLAAKSLRYACAAIDPALTVRADGEKVQQILLNLLSNAIKFTAANGSVRVGAEGDARVVRITVTDNGIGIPADMHETVFEPFVQLGRGSRAGQEGTGLGLAISRDLARAMNGDLTVRSTPGEGSTFTLSLPRA